MTDANTASSTSNAGNAPFRYDVVGSFLRPDVLKRALADHVAGTIDDAQLKAVEDEAIRDLVAKQQAAGLHVITDGEFRRSYWHLDFMWGLGGIERRTARQGYQFHDEETTADTAVVTGRISGQNHPFVSSTSSSSRLSRRTVRSRARPSPRRSRPTPRSCSTAATVRSRACRRSIPRLPAG